MRTNIVTDDELMEQTIAVSGITTKREVVEQAMREFVARRSRKDLLELRGAIAFADDYDDKRLREGK